jgi:hypothetical protein
MSALPNELRALTEAETCAALGICRNSLRALRRSGVLPYFTVGRAIRYQATAVQAFMENGGPYIGPKARRAIDNEK